jgi:hypothetical protein
MQLQINLKKLNHKIMSTKQTLLPLTKRQRQRRKLYGLGGTNEQIERSQQPVRNKLIVRWNSEAFKVEDFREGFRAMSEERARLQVSNLNTKNIKSAIWYDNDGESHDVLIPAELDPVIS